MAEEMAVASAPAAASAGRRLADAATWRRLLSAGDQKAFSTAWLELLVAQIDLCLGPLVGQDGAEPTSVVRQAMVALAAPEGQKFVRTAWLGADREVSLLLAKAGERAIQMRHGAVQVGEGPGALCQIAHPILVGEMLYGVVALELPAQAKEQLDVAMRLSQWGVAWFAHLVTGRSRQMATPDDIAVRLAILAAAVAGRRLAYGLESAITLMAEQFEVDKIAIGLHRRRHTRLLALSHGGFSEIRNAYLAGLTAAMEETADSEGHGAYPVPAEQLAAPHAAHAALARAHGAHWVRSVAVPLESEAGDQLVLLAEGQNIAPDGIEKRLEQVAADLAPLIALRLGAESGVVNRLGHDAAALIRARPIWRNGVIAAAVLLAVGAMFVTLPYRISVDATLEPRQRQTIAAPYDGYLAAATARPGDRVAKGALLARFDDTDLLHQRSDIEDRLSETTREMNQAIGLMDRAKASVLSARRAEIAAELALVNAQIGRSDLRAPFDAVVVAGDKTQSIGAPMHRGEALYELSPLGAFRVTLDIPQADFAAIAPGQEGQLVLTALPYESWPIRVSRLTPIAIAHDGETVLRAEAELSDAKEVLRPGMQGVADIKVGHARLGWLLTHRIADWLWPKLWEWLP